MDAHALSQSARAHCAVLISTRERLGLVEAQGAMARSTDVDGFAAAAAA